MSLDIQTVADRYAKALFELAQEQGTVADTYEELVAIRDVFEQNPQLAPSLTGIKMAPADKAALLATLTTDASPLVQNLLHMLFDYGRMPAVVAIVDEFERRFDQQEKRVHADVTTAVALDEPRRAQLKQNLLARFGAQEIVLHETVDESILGGVIVTAQNKTLDGSVKTKIEQLRRLLLN